MRPRFASQAALLLVQSAIGAAIFRHFCWVLSLVQHRFKKTEPLTWAASQIFNLHEEANNLNKYILLAIPVGVAAGLSLPFIVPAPKAKQAPLPKPVAPQVVVEGIELGHKPKASASISISSVSVKQPENLGSLASEPVYLEPVKPAMIRRKHRARRLDTRTMRRLQIEDSRAWQAADRLLQYELRGA